MGRLSDTGKSKQFAAGVNRSMHHSVPFPDPYFNHFPTDLAN